MPVCMYNKPSFVQQLKVCGPEKVKATNLDSDSLIQGNTFITAESNTAVVLLN